MVIGKYDRAEVKGKSALSLVLDIGERRKRNVEIDHRIKIGFLLGK